MGNARPSAVTIVPYFKVLPKNWRLFKKLCEQFVDKSQTRAKYVSITGGVFYEDQAQLP